MKNKFFTLLLAVMASVGTMFAQSGTCTIADIYNMAQDSAITMGAFDVVYVASYQNGANIYIKDETGSLVIYKPGYGLQAGDHVAAGMECKVNIYHSLYEIVPVSAKEDLTITPGEAPAPMEAVEVPTLANVNQYVVYKNVSFATDTAFVSSKRHGVYGAWHSQEIYFFNQYYIGASLKADKTYNIVAVNTVYGTTLQVYPLAVEEVGKPSSNTITIAEAIEIGMAMDSMATSTETYTIEGYVINAGSFNTSSKTQSWYMADDKNATTSSFQAYRCYPIYGNDTVAVTNGNKVRMTGKLQKYYNRSTASYLVEMTRVPATILDSQEEIETITVAQALEIGSTLESLASTQKEYIIKGYVSNIVTPFDEQYKNETFFITDVKGARTNDKTQAFEIYRGKPNTGKEVGLDAYILIRCKIKNYRGIIENDGVNVVFDVLEQGHGVEDDTPTPCISASGTCGENLTWELSCDSVLTISGTGAMTDFAYTTAPWYEYRDAIKSVIIGEGVTSIGTHSLQNCRNISKVSISNSVSSIGDHAFWDCYGLTTITIPRGVKSIGNTAFHFCENLVSFSVAEDNPVFSSVEGVLFNKGKTTLVKYPCRKSTSYVIPSGTTTIGEDAFYYCDELISISFPESVKTIENFAFGYCSSLTSVVLPSSLDSIGTQAFQSCRGLTSVIISDNVKYIGSNAFAYCNGLTSINIPASTLIIKDGAFGGCSGLTTINTATENPNYCSVDGVLFSKDKTILMQYPAGKSETSYSIPNTVTNIYSEAFENCKIIESVDIPNTVISIGRSAFYNCSNLTAIDIPNSVINIEDIAFYQCSNLSSLTLGRGVKTIQRSAFKDCSKLTTITCKASTPPFLATTLGTNVFAGVDKSIPLYVPLGSKDAYSAADQWKDFTNIQEFQCLIASGTCGENLKWELSCDSILTISGIGEMENYKYTAAPWFDHGSIVLSVVIEDGVTSIGDYAFADCQTLRSVEIPNSVISIGSRAFLYCFDLTSIKLPDNLTTIQERAFASCINLTSVVIPNNVTTIEEYAFQECSKMVSVSIPESVTNIAEYAFFSCYSLMSIYNYSSTPQIINENVFGGKPQYFYPGGGSIEINQEALDKSKCTLYVPVQSLEAYKAADVWKDFGTILPIDETPCLIASGACGNNLTWELSCDSVLTISGTGAMWRLTEEQAWRPYKESIKVAILPEGLDSIAPKAFYQCVNLTSVNLPNSVRAVGYAALYDCERLAVPVYNDRILAFMPFDHAGTYTVPEGIVALASYAFQPGIESHVATEIILPSSVKRLGAYSLGWGYQKLTCLATTPPVCDAKGTFYFNFDDVGVIASIDRSTPVYVPAGSLEAYKAADQWKEFFNIQAIPTDPQDANLNVVYIDPSNSEIQRETITLHLPAAPMIEGFTFLKWQVVAGDLEDAIFIQAVYTENDPQSAPAVYTNPANPTQKLIRNGNVYVLTGDKVYTITGQAVK